MTPLRELNRKALDPARSVVVEAVAGSGKTWLLVSRILRLLIDGVAPSEILAITFTRKAAQEMAERLREWLLFLATAPDGEVREFLAHRELPAEKLAEAIRQSRVLYERFLTAQPPLTISTFHSWFLQLLRRAPLDAGAPGEVNLVEQTGSLVQEAWQRFGSRVQREPDSELARALDCLFRDYGLDSTRKLLRNFVLRRADWWVYTQGQRDPVAWAMRRMAADMQVEPQENVAQRAFQNRELRSKLHEYAELLSRNTTADAKLAAAYYAACSGNDSDALLRCALLLALTVEGSPRVRKATKQAKNLGRAGENRMLELHGELVPGLLTLAQHRADQICYRVNEAALTCGVALIETYQALKDERQAIDYGDIEWLAYRLVAAGEHAVYMQYKLDARYRHILIDEFQDTNPLQWLTVKSWFAAAAEADSRPVVFLVGDPKQSIYRFRRAEARLFDEAALFLQKEFGASKVLQQESRRCALPIIDVVNRLFAGEPDFKGFETHTAHDAKKPGRVEVLPLVQKIKMDSGPGSIAPGARSGVNVSRENDGLALRNPLLEALQVEEDLRRETEARQLVERINDIVGRWHITDEDAPGKTRSASYRDIMLLVKKRTHLQIYERALRGAGIPFVTSRQGGLLGTLEAQDLVALLQFIVSPFADLQLAHVLRAPIFSCSDDDLIALAQVDGETWWQRLTHHALETTASAALRRAHLLLSGWLAQSDVLPVHDQLDRIYFEGDVVRRYTQAVPEAMRDSVQANLHAFMQRALDTDAGRYPSLPRFLHELMDLAQAAADEAPDEGIVGDVGDAIRIYTVHGAKGLEKPIVWLLDAAAGKEPGDSYYVMTDWPPGADAPVHFSVCTRKAEHGARQRALADAEETLARREELNLLYVAMTRAQQALFVSGCDGQGREGSWYEKVRAGVRAAAGLELTKDELAESAEYGQSLAPPIADLFAATPERAAAEVSVDAALTRPLPTGVCRPGSSTRGQRYGTHFHAVMERLTASPVCVDRAVLRNALGLPEAEFAAHWDSAHRLIRTERLARFFDSTKYKRAANEIAYVSANGDVQRMDRLVEFADEVWVLDYKTGEPPAETLMAQYQAQLESYRTAVSAIVPDKPVKTLLLFSTGATFPPLP